MSATKHVRHQAVIAEPYRINGVAVRVEIDGFDNHRIVVVHGGQDNCGSWQKPRGISLIVVLIDKKFRTFVTGGRYWERTLAPAFELISPS